jgi:hypothetical protein
MTLQQLQKTWSDGMLRFVEIVDRGEAKKQVDCKCVCCWGSGKKIGDTDWVQLSSPSLRFPAKHRTVFVCKESLIKG